jgi:SAM-dependent methyltransferase
MEVFNDYSAYYDLLYQDKNYKAEVDYLDQLIKTHGVGAKTILELGCGTGKHAFLLAGKGYSVHGIDLSEQMLQCAHSNLSSHKEYKKNAMFSLGDLRTIRLKKKFDVILSLFHVMSYQTTNLDLQKAFETASKHLNPKGLFIFDFWYGPAVEFNKLKIRIKKFDNESLKIVRIAEPTIHTKKHVVDIDFTIYIHEKKTKKIQKLQEKHSMRYLFEPEIKKLCIDNKFKLINFQEWLSGKKPGKDSWGVCMIARKNC